MNIGIISKVGLGDLLQSLMFLPSIDKNLVGKKEWSLFVKHDPNREKMIERLVSTLFCSDMDVNVVYYDPRDEKNIIQKANEICDWVFAPMVDDSSLCPKWMRPSSFSDTKLICGTAKNVKETRNKDIFANTSVFCHLYSGSRGEERNLPFETRNRIGKFLLNKFGQYGTAFFSWDDPDADKYDFKIIKNPDIIEIIQSENHQLYVGVDSWVHSLISGTNDWICWTEKEWKMNTQRVAMKTFVCLGFRQIISSCNVDQILTSVESL